MIFTRSHSYAAAESETGPSSTAQKGLGIFLPQRLGVSPVPKCLHSLFPKTPKPEPCDLVAKRNLTTRFTAANGGTVKAPSASWAQLCGTWPCPLGASRTCPAPSPKGLAPTRPAGPSQGTRQHPYPHPSSAPCSGGHWHHARLSEDLKSSRGAMCLFSTPPSRLSTWHSTCLCNASTMNPRP